MVVSDSADPGELGLQLVPCDREQPGCEIGTQLIFAELRKGDNQSSLSNIVDIDGWRGLSCQPDSKWSLELSYDLLKRRNIPRKSAADSFLN